jgi:lactoylglutathione lyase
MNLKVDNGVGIKTLGTSKGLLELYHIPSDADTPYVSGNNYPGPGVGFGHIGFTVPDVSETLARVGSFGYEIIKPLNEARVEQMGMPEGVVEGREGKVEEGYEGVFRQLAFVRDPDVSFTKGDCGPC